MRVCVCACVCACDWDVCVGSVVRDWDVRVGSVVCDWMCVHTMFMRISLYTHKLLHILSCIF